MQSSLKKIAIFASGSGSNAQCIFEHFANNNEADITMVVSNNPKAGVLSKAEKFSIPTMIVNKEDLYHSEKIVDQLQELKIDLIVLAGFLWFIPANLLRTFTDRIINIHPALLPKYGGKGMYGMHVHKAVKESGDEESGMTIHYVNENYDEGKIIFQSSVAIDTQDTPESIASKVLELEHQHYPNIIEKIIRELS